VVDGIVGLGGGAGLREPAPALVSGVADGAVVVAVDLPSGVEPDTGETPAEHVRADVTVTFGTGKPCLLLPPAASAAGRVRVVDIGVGPHLPPEPAVDRLSPADAGRLWPVPAAASDKYRRGVVGVVAGSSGTRAPRCSPARAPSGPAWAWSGTSARPDRGGRRRAPPTPRSSPARAGSRPGSSAPASTPDGRRDRRRPGGRDRARPRLRGALRRRRGRLPAVAAPSRTAPSRTPPAGCC
jgi:hypothetical protein